MSRQLQCILFETKMSGRKRKKCKCRTGRKQSRGRLRGALVVIETRSHGSVKGKNFVDDGNTEEYC